jgi:iron complex transport system ATP-binding protein
METPRLEARGVTYKIGAHTIVADIDLAVRPGEILALAGPNGAGKSTLLGLLAGDLPPSAGAVLLGENRLDGIGQRELARWRAVLLQENHVSFPFTVADVVRMGRAPLGPAAAADDAAVAAVLAATDTIHLAQRRFPSLSGGEKARVSFARVLAQEARILLLDEPTAALDIRHQELVMGLARDLAYQGRAVVAVLHDLTLAAAWADRLALMGGGRLVAVGPVAEVATAAALSQLYEHPVAVTADPVTGLPVVLPRRGLVECVG